MTLPRDNRNYVTPPLPEKIVAILRETYNGSDWKEKFNALPSADPKYTGTKGRYSRAKKMHIQGADLVLKKCGIFERFRNQPNEMTAVDTVDYIDMLVDNYKPHPDTTIQQIPAEVINDVLLAMPFINRPTLLEITCVKEGDPVHELAKSKIYDPQKFLAAAEHIGKEIPVGYQNLLFIGTESNRYIFAPLLDPI